jgi:flavin reductase (DIM6/NTAB) family NADH-FMN oxidoreductase RutF
MLPTCRNENLPVNVVRRRQFSWGGSLSKEFRTGSEGSSGPNRPPVYSPAESTKDKLGREPKPSAVLNNQDTTVEEHSTPGKVGSERLARGPSILTADFEAQSTEETTTHSRTCGPFRYDSRFWRPSCSRRGQIFLHLSRNHWDHRVFNHGVVNGCQAFTTTTSARVRATDEVEVKQELETAGVLITNNGEQAVPLPGLGRSTIVNKPAAIDRVEISTQVRQAMRTVPQPVCIITSTDVSTGAPIFRGATISSFNTVTIEPTTIISLNIKRPSSTFDAIKSSSYFVVHLLKADQTTRDLATTFTKGSSTDPFRTLKKVSQVNLPEVAPVDNGPPLIEDCLSPGRLLCRYLPQKTVQLGDHVVVFGTVDSVTKELGDFDDPHTTCLAYANGRYGSVGPLELSSATKISKAAFGDFMCRLELMDHRCLCTVIPSHADLDLLPRTVQVSLGSLHSKGRALFNFIKHDEMLRSTKSRTYGVGLQTRPMSSLSHGILKAVTFYHIFLTSMHRTDSTSPEAPHLPLEAAEALKKYQIFVRGTYYDLSNIRDTLQNLHDPWTTYQPPLSDTYSVERFQSKSLGEKLSCLYWYIHFCLVPLAYPDRSTAAFSILRPLVTQYNATLRTLQKDNFQPMYYHTSRTDDVSATQSTSTHTQARAAIMQVYRKDILPAWIKSAAKMAEHLQNASGSFQGLGNELMASLKQYHEICRETAEQLHAYKAFLFSTGLQKYYNNRDEVRPPHTRHRSSRVSNTRQRKRLEHSLLESKIQATYTPLRRVRPTFSVRKHIAADSQFVKNYKPGDNERVTRGDLGLPLAVTEVGLNRRLRFLDPYARQAEEAEWQEKAIQRGLEDIQKLMAEEMKKRSTPSRANVVDRWVEGEKGVVEDETPPETRACSSKLV